MVSITVRCHLGGALVKYIQISKHRKVCSLHLHIPFVLGTPFRVARTVLVQRTKYRLWCVYGATVQCVRPSGMRQSGTILHSIPMYSFYYLYSYRGARNIHPSHGANYYYFCTSTTTTTTISTSHNTTTPLLHKLVLLIILLLILCYNYYYQYS